MVPAAKVRWADLVFCRAIIWVVGFVIAIPGMVGVYLGLHAIQARYIPVVVDFEVTRFEKLAPDKIEMWGNLTKRFEYGDGLPLCRYAGQSWWVRLPTGKLVEASWFSLERPFGQTVNRQPGFQSWGPWIIDYRGSPDAVEAFGVASHWCAGFWLSETKLGPLKLRAADYLPPR